jgi:hypothetical protein
MKTSVFKVLIISASSALALITSIQAADSPPFFGGEPDVRFAQALWTSMEESGLVGGNAINVFPFNGNQPHGAIQQVLDTDISVNGRSSRVIVKRNHGGKDIDVKSVYSDPVSHLKAVTVMFKREAGYDSENLDWFWVKFTPSGEIDKNPKGIKLAGRIGKDGSGGCIACHKAIGGSDLETLTIK